MNVDIEVTEEEETLINNHLYLLANPDIINNLVGLSNIIDEITWESRDGSACGIIKIKEICRAAAKEINSWRKNSSAKRI